MRFDHTQKFNAETAALAELTRQQIKMGELEIARLQKMLSVLDSMASTEVQPSDPLLSDNIKMPSIATRPRLNVAAGSEGGV